MWAVEVWQLYSTGNTRRFLPIHQRLPALGAAKCKSLIKAHILSGDDFVSKVGTKKAAVHFDPEEYFSRFGEEGLVSEQDVSHTEEYLVKLWSGVRWNTRCKTSNKLRLEKYLTGTGTDTLPPTSSVIRGHKHLAALLVYRNIHLLDRDPKELDPHEFGGRRTLA